MIYVLRMPKASIGWWVEDSKRYSQNGKTSSLHLWICNQRKERHKEYEVRGYIIQSLSVVFVFSFEEEEQFK